MAEDHRCEAQAEAPRLCVNNCGFFGSPATLGLCSKCYRDQRLKEEQEASAKKAVEKSFSAVASAASSASPLSLVTPAEIAPPLSPSRVAPAVVEPVVEPSAIAAAEPPAAQPGRCVACRKRVGLTGFRCRCGEMFCGSHRYPEQHRCTFDFKSAGREAIARANPIVKADKLDKI